MASTELLIERSRDWKQSPASPRRTGDTVVADGYGISIHVNRGQLVVSDGVGRQRRERRYHRPTSSLARLVVLGGSGSLTLDAMRWLASVGASLVCIDRDGRLLLTSAATRSEARLRRAQALAPFNQAGLDITRTLLAAKLDGQARVLDALGADTLTGQVVDRARAGLDRAESIAEAVGAEAEAAAAYWAAWADVEVRFAPADQRRVPDHWRRFGARGSLLTSGGPRLAVTPAGAILNYLYALLEAEARLACLTVGLDPALAIVHADVQSRDSLPLDLMEAVRPDVDRYLVTLLRDRVFRAGDFYETRRGVCRLLAPLTHELADTLPAWRQLIAPITEQVAATLAKSQPRPGSSPTRLTQANHRADRAKRHGQESKSGEVRVPRPERRCKRCGSQLPHRTRVYCDDCLPHFQPDKYAAFTRAGLQSLSNRRGTGDDPSHSKEADEKRSASMARSRREQHEWHTAHRDSPADPEEFTREILPGLKAVPLADLIRATGLSSGYLAQVRRGEKAPHPRHWAALRQVHEVT